MTLLSFKPRPATAPEPSAEQKRAELVSYYESKAAFAEKARKRWEEHIVFLGALPVADVDRHYQKMLVTRDPKIP